MRKQLLGLALIFAVSGFAQDSPAPAESAGSAESAAPAMQTRETPDVAEGEYLVETGTRVPLKMINSISTKNAAAGDRIYLETVFPILADGHIVIPPGSYVAGTVTDVKRPGRLKGRGEIYVRFDSLTLPNGVTRDFRARIGSLDGRATEELERDEGKIESEGNKAGDARTVGEAAATGASAGALAGAVSGSPGTGTLIGVAGGAAAGLVGVLLSRGPDAVLASGTTLEMVLDRNLVFTEEEIDFSGAQQYRPSTSDGPGPQPRNQNQSRGRFPF